MERAARRVDEGAPRPLRHRGRFQSPIPRRRQLAGWAVVLVGLPALTAALTVRHSSLTFATELLLFLSVATAAGAIGGPYPGVTAALGGSILANYFFVAPRYTLRIGDRENLLALLVFVAVTATVSLYVHLSARRALDAQRARAEAEALARSANTLAAAPDPLPLLLDQLRALFGTEAVALRQRQNDGITVIAHSGDVARGDDAGGTTVLDLGSGRELVLLGPELAEDDRRALRSHADQLAVALETRALREDAARAAVVREADELRTAMLRAVSHDLRTPLASIKASVTSLLADDVDWAEEDRRDFLHTVDAETDRMTRLVGNLLDMSRLQAGVVTLHLAPTAVDDVVANALASVSGLPDDVIVDVPADLALIDVDPELLERAVANVVANAAAWSPAGRPVRIEAAQVDDLVHLRVIDRGPGIPADRRDAARQPFQRAGDSGGPAPAGVGLGLAVAIGFVTALGGELALEDTQGGGLTVDMALPTTDRCLPEDAP